MSMIRCGLFGVFNVDYTRTNFSSKPKMDVSEDSLSIFNLELFCTLFRVCFLWGRTGSGRQKKRFQFISKKTPACV